MIRRSIFICLISCVVIIAGVLLFWKIKLAKPHQSPVEVVLSTKQTEFRLGEPMLFRMEFINPNNKVMHLTNLWDYQPFQTIDPDGNNLYYVEAAYQSSPDSVKLGPESRTLVMWTFYPEITPMTDIDLLNKYMLLKEGEYTIHVPSRHKWTLPSNAVKFTVRGGEAPLIDKIIESLILILPEGWHAGRFGYKPRIMEIDGSPTECLPIELWRSLKGEDISLIVTSNCLDKPYPTTAPPGKRAYLGSNEYGYFYATIGCLTEKVWPTQREDIIDALKIK